MRCPSIAIALGCALLVSSATVWAQPSTDAGTDSSSRAWIDVDAGRRTWPIVREPSGQWGVVGEAVARHRGPGVVAIQKVTFVVLGLSGRRLLEQVFDTPESLLEIVRVYRRDASGALTMEASTLLNPGDVGVAFLAGLIDPRSLPGWALVRMSFSEGRPRTIAVPLVVFDPGQRMGWPLGLANEPWVALNAPGTGQHWVGGAIPTDRDLFISQRFALDLVQIDGNGQTHPAWADGKEDYYAWDEEVLSTGRGRVVAVVNGERDLEIGEMPGPVQNPAGNLVVVQHGPRVFSLYAHLRQGSATVHVGDWVERGQLLGRVGNSGISTEPHLHMHFADTWPPASDPAVSLYFSQGVPAGFWGAYVLRDGSVFRLNGTIPLEFDVIVKPGT